MTNISGYRKIAPLLRILSAIFVGFRYHRSILGHLTAIFIALSPFLVACHKSGTKSEGQPPYNIAYADMITHGKMMEQLLEAEELALRSERYRVEKPINLIIGAVLVGGLLLVIGWMVYLDRERRHHRILKETIRMRTHFLTNITHEFRTPLTLIIGLSRDLVEKASTAEVKEMAQTIYRQGDSLLGLINQLLDVAKVKSTIERANWRNGDITAYLTMIVESFHDYAHNQQIDSKRPSK